jgi:hypothetical protein
MQKGERELADVRAHRNGILAAAWLWCGDTPAKEGWREVVNELLLTEGLLQDLCMEE